MKDIVWVAHDVVDGKVGADRPDLNFRLQVQPPSSLGLSMTADAFRATFRCVGNELASLIATGEVVL